MKPENDALVFLLRRLCKGHPDTSHSCGAVWGIFVEPLSKVPQCAAGRCYSQYEQLKIRLAEEFSQDREGYTQGRLYSRYSKRQMATVWSWISLTADLRIRRRFAIITEFKMILGKVFCCQVCMIGA